MCELILEGEVDHHGGGILYLFVENGLLFPISEIRISSVPAESEPAESEANPTVSYT